MESNVPFSLKWNFFNQKQLLIYFFLLKKSVGDGSIIFHTRFILLYTYMNNDRRETACPTLFHVEGPFIF
jgi:hypothetical protein